MIRIIAIFAALFTVDATAQVQDGASIYQRCAACHLPNGAGVPGAFPPLKTNVTTFAATKAGRRYLALVVIRGVSGPIAVGDKSFRGTMPAQGSLNDAQVAAVLNHVLTGSAAKPYSESEVAGYRVGAASLNSAAVAGLRPSTGGK